MVKRADAPPPGWYPDPTGRSGLLWWDGLDWTRHHRPAPPASGAEFAPDRASEGREPVGAAEGGPAAIPSATQLRSRGTTATREAEREIADAVAEARRVARSEVDRAVQQATAQFDRTRQQWQPRLEAYWRRAKRWLRILVLLVVLFVVLQAWAGATLQTSLLEWLGERIDAATAVVDLPAR